MCSKSCLILLIDLLINNKHVLDLFAVSRGHDASQITLALGTAAAYPRACQALGAMLSKGALNPADITVLFKMFSSMDPPPVELVRIYIYIYAFNNKTLQKSVLTKTMLTKLLFSSCRSEFLLSWICSCNRYLNPELKSTRTTSTNTSTS